MAIAAQAVLADFKVPLVPYHEDTFGQHAGEQPREEELESQEEDCWTFGGIDRVEGSLVRPETCCAFPPCGLSVCWSVASFSYDFCCGEPACRPAVVAAVRQAVADGLQVPNATMASVQQRAPRAFRAVRQMLWSQKGQVLLKESVNRMQECVCAFAYAAAVIARGEATSTIYAGWFTHGFNWSLAATKGWAALLALPALLSDVGDRLSPVSWESGAGRLPTFPRRPSAGFWQRAQEAAQRLGVEELQPFHALARAGEAVGLWQRLLGAARAELHYSQASRKCVAVRSRNGRGKWVGCVPWEYSRDADYSSPRPGAGAARGMGQAAAAVCVLGAPRGVVDTFESLRTRVLDALAADAFAYIPFSGTLSQEMEQRLTNLGPIVTAIAVLDVDRAGMEQRFFNELELPELKELYREALGPWRAPIYGQMGSSAWVYHMQHTCQRMVEAYEVQRRQRYDWFVFARADLQWLHPHPGLAVLSPNFVHVPRGQDNNHYFHGPFLGLNDRHAAVPRRWVDAYFGRWQSLIDGRLWEVLKIVALLGHQINTEQFLFIHLAHLRVPVRRFPPVAFVVHCAEGPQCQHLYKGTNLRKQQWTAVPKYWTELVEVSRTLKELPRKHGRYDAAKGILEWIWTELRPHTNTSPVIFDPPHPYEVHSMELACCLTPSGPASCYSWIFLGKCKCLA